MRFALRRLERSFQTGRVLPYLIGAITALVLIFGVVIRLVDRDDFPTIGLALWWAVQTITTVGYGDVAPQQPAGRGVAAALMIVGFASLSLLTGITASALIARRTSPREQVDQAITALERIERRLDRLERLVSEAR